MDHCNDLHGILLLDKPFGLTSNQVVQRVKKNLQIKHKVGHTGSLDPLATGVLPICIGEATKFANFLLDADKTYQVKIQLGLKTDTGDLDGQILAKNDQIDNMIFEPGFLEQILSKFIGVNIQEPPIYSALKSKGVPLYKIARKYYHNLSKDNLDLTTKTAMLEELTGLVKAKAREIRINAIKLIEVNQLARTINLEVDCSKGTYIRSLVVALGDRLNCYATTAALRRIKVANLGEGALCSLEDLSELASSGKISLIQQYLLPMESCLDNLNRLVISPEQGLCLQQGKKILMTELKDLYAVGSLVSIFVQTGDRLKLLGVGEITLGDGLISRRLIRI